MVISWKIVAHLRTFLSLCHWTQTSVVSLLHACTSCMSPSLSCRHEFCSQFRRCFRDKNHRLTIVLLHFRVNLAVMMNATTVNPPERHLPFRKCTLQQHPRHVGLPNHTEFCVQYRQSSLLFKPFLRRTPDHSTGRACMAHAEAVRGCRCFLRLQERAGGR